MVVTGRVISWHHFRTVVREAAYHSPNSILPFPIQQYYGHTVDQQTVFPCLCWSNGWSSDENLISWTVNRSLGPLGFKTLCAPPPHPYLLLLTYLLFLTPCWELDTAAIQLPLYQRRPWCPCCRAWEAKTHRQNLASGLLLCGFQLSTILYF